ncbi:hypothetical protein IYW40_11630 [Methylocystis sp. H4A]|uniref:hypothetical protein n=1 Tax=Methylocystis sp. H4A TaxID=2785788 RepID=UPI0018C28B69|nr:hypothetical protein [Methylocystis sp. H4A]MBG0802124.1 hypothetical protein [Methylocystis sp. H4A]
MAWRWPWQKQTIEKRSAMSGFTAELMAAREAYISGRSGLAELTSAAQSCISLWENGFVLAKVEGTDLLTRSSMGVIARALALRGEYVGLLRDDGLVHASDWDVRTVDGKPRAYRISISEAGGGMQVTALAAEVIHVRIGSDVSAPWAGQAPLRRASISAGLLQAVESAIAEIYETAPLGSQVCPMPEQAEVDLTALGRSFSGKRGKVLLRESVAVSAAGGPVPAIDWRPAGLTPDLRGAMTVETLEAARHAIYTVFGVLPAAFDKATTGPLVREFQRHLGQWVLQPMCELVSEQVSEKTGASVQIDCMTPSQAFDVGQAARSFATLVEGMAAAKEAGLDEGAVAAAFRRLDWES